MGHIRFKSQLSKYLVVALLLFAFVGCGYYSLFRKPTFNLRGEAPVWLYVYPNTDWKQVEKSIQSVTEVGNFKFGMKLLLLVKPDANPRPGAYQIEPNSTIFSFCRKLVSGLQTPVRLSFTSARLPEQIWSRIAEQIMADSLSVAKAMNDVTALSLMGVKDSTMAYRLMPNTYEVYWTISPKSLVQKMEKEYQNFWSHERLSKAESLGLTPYEVTILASIVQEESAKTDEYPLIAGLYINRLKRGIPLQADPTVKYALRDFQLRRILRSHLAVDSPYNTYKVVGLPPSPICIPNQSAIDGVLLTKPHNYIYMVAKADFSGYHDFSETLSEHTRKANLYRKALNDRGIYK